MLYIVTVDDAKCEGCEECVNICPQGVFEMEDSKSLPSNSSECVYCESCLGVCPTEAITITEM
ncbi:MAG TPA: 4Fe-4S dicluster domain-containing protein [Nitrospirae bacterium]|nr:4Fe-4S dicluster domain-containing protein [Nitrospirota bacterium]